MRGYTIERVHKIDSEVYAFLCGEIEGANEALGNIVDFTNFDVWNYAVNNCVWIARLNGKPVGVMFAQLYGSVFDPKTKVLFQDGLYVQKSRSRAAFLLLNEFIDFGRANAKIIFTCRGKYTNVKARSLERLGFEKAEELWRLSVGG